MTDNLPQKQDKPNINISSDGTLVPQNFEQLWRLACVFADSGIMPQEYNRNPAAIVVASQFGAQLGLTLMGSLQNISVINNRPALWGDAQKAIVISSGTLEVFVEYYTGTYDNDDYTAVCIAKRKGVGFDYDPNDDLDTMRKKGIFVNEFSVADAKLAGLWGGVGADDFKKKKSPWYRFPKRQLKMRARSLTLRDGWQDALKGMASGDEMADGELSETPINVTPQDVLITHKQLEDALGPDTRYDGKDNDDMSLYDMTKNKVVNSVVVPPEDTTVVQSEPDPTPAESPKPVNEVPKQNVTPPKQPLKDSSAEGWDPYSNEPMKRYTPDKRDILIDEAERKGIEIKGKTPRQVHLELLQHDRQKALFNMSGGKNNDTVSESPQPAETVKTDSTGDDKKAEDIKQVDTEDKGDDEKKEYATSIDEKFWEVMRARGITQDMDKDIIECIYHHVKITGVEGKDFMVQALKDPVGWIFDFEKWRKKRLEEQISEDAEKKDDKFDRCMKADRAKMMGIIRAMKQFDEIDKNMEIEEFSQEVRDNVAREFEENTF